MSFDLYVWHESTPVTAEEASDKLDRSSDASAPTALDWDKPEGWQDGASMVVAGRLTESEKLLFRDAAPDVVVLDGDELREREKGDLGLFGAHPNVMAFYNALMERFPESSSDDDEFDGVWSVPPQPSDTLVGLCISFSDCGEVASAVRQLASDHGLVCYDPQAHAVWPNVPGYQAAFTLSSENGPTVPDPSSSHIARAMRHLNPDNYFVLLERADGWFVQAGYGEDVGLASGCYAMEYQEGSTDRQYRVISSDVADVQRFLQEFLDGQDTWKRRHDWEKLNL